MKRMSRFVLATTAAAALAISASTFAQAYTGSSGLDLTKAPAPIAHAVTSSWMNSVKPGSFYIGKQIISMTNESQKVLGAQEAMTANKWFFDDGSAQLATFEWTKTGLGKALQTKYELDKDPAVLAWTDYLGAIDSKAIIDDGSGQQQAFGDMGGVLDIKVPGQVGQFAMAALGGRHVLDGAAALAWSKA